MKRSIKASAPLTPRPGAVVKAAAPPKRRLEEEEPVPEPDDEDTALSNGASSGKLQKLRQQIEFYFSDDGLREDRYLHGVISDSPGGWVDLATVLSLRQVRALRAKRDDVLRALSNSWLETWRDEDGVSAALRRPTSKGPLPKLGAARPKAKPAAAAPRSAAAQGAASGGAGASAPARASAGAPPADGAEVLLPGKMNGTIVSFDEESGSASIACKQTEVLFHKNVTIDWQELEQCGAFDIGARVSFRVALGTTGEPMAKELVLRPPAPDDAMEEEEQQQEEDQTQAAPAEEWPEEEMVKPPPGRPAKKPKTSCDQAQPGNRYQGFIKSFHKGVGLGFISCRETFAAYSRDIAIEKSQIGGFAVGDKVTFLLVIDTQLGTPKAEALEPADAQPEAESAEQPPEKEEEAPAARAAQQPSKKPPSAATGATVGAALKKKPPAAAAAAAAAAAPAAQTKKPQPAQQQKAAAAANGAAKATAAPVKRLVGSVKSINAKLGIGKIACSSTAGDVTVAAAELAGFGVGDGVSFALSKDPRFGGERPWAVELEAEDVPE